MKKTAALMVSLLACVALAACGGAPAAESSGSQAASQESQSSQESQASKASQTTFTVGFDQDLPPMGFVGEDGKFTGFDLELAEEAAKRMGMEIKYQPIAWDAKDMELSSGTIDCIWNGFTMNGREEQYLWSKPYMENQQVFVVKSDAGIASLEDLAGKTVEVQVDSSAEAALKDDAALTATFGKLQTTAEYNTAFMDLDMGGVDAVAMDSVVANYQIQQRNSDAFTILPQAISSETYGVGFKLGNTELRDQVQKALDDMAADGTMAKISEKWFGKDVTVVGK